MKKMAAGVLTLVLVVSMTFAAVPFAYAGEISSIETTPASDFNNTTTESTTPAEGSGVSVGQPSSGQNAQPGQSTGEAAPGTMTPGTTNPDGADPDSFSPDTTGTYSSDTGGVPTSGSTSGDTVLAEGNAALTMSSSVNGLGISTSGRFDSALEKARALVELVIALDNLYRTIRTASGPSIVYSDNGSITEEDLSVVFQEGVYYTKIVTLVNKINILLEKCGLDAGLYVTALPISVVGELPEGFSFSNNTLTLTDSSLLSWNANLDKPDALTRSYEITLQLNTGVTYIDQWLSRKGVNSLAGASFVVELQLINLPESEVPDEGDEDDTPIPPVPNPPAPPSDNPGVSPGTASAAPSSSGANDAAALVIEEAPATNTTTPETEQPATENDTANTTTDIAGQQIPMASMMVRDSGDNTAANVGLTVLSLLLSGASLLSLRQQKPGGTKTLVAAAQPSQVGMTLGFAGIGLGAVSAILLVLSQCTSNIGIAWTPVLLTIGVVQILCTVGLFASKKIASKNAAPSRYKIRY